MLTIIQGILSLAFIGIFGWAIQLGNRVSVIETKHEDIISLINSRFDGVSQRLDRIERAMNGSLKGH